MFGYLLVSNKNEVITFGGDREFDNYLHTSLQKEVHFSADSPSTSSGVYTDSSTESLCIHEESTVSREPRNSKKSSLIAKQEVVHLFLPLISIYRSQNARESDNIHCTTSEQVTILFKRLNSNFLLISVGNSEKLQRQFLDYMVLGLEVTSGPLVGLIDSDLSTVKLGWDFMKNVTEKPCIHVNRKVRGFLDVRKAIYLHSELENLLPFLRILTSQLQSVLGSHRCLLMSNGEVLASINSSSDENHIWRSIEISDLNFLIQLVTAQKSSEDGNIFQVWLRSTKYVVPYYVDVIASTTSSGLKFVFLSEAKHSPLIRNIAAFLVQLDRIQNSDDVMREVRDIKKTMEAITQHLLAMATTSSNTSRRKAAGGFMRNPERTASFIETTWQEAEDLLVASNTKSDGPDRRSANASLGSLKSAFSTISLSSSVLASPLDKKNLSLKCEMRLDYVRRQGTNVIQELCSDSHGFSAQEKLALFQETMFRVLGTTQATALSDLEMAMKKKSALFKSFMRPISMNLDMIAYSVTIPSKSISVTFIPDDSEWIKDEFDSSMRAPTSRSYVEVTRNSGQRYKLYMMTNVQEESKSGLNVFKSLRNIYFNGAPTTKAYAIALFEEGIHNNLAENEVSRLLEAVTNQMSSTFPVFC